MKHNASPAYSAQIYQEACEWFVEFRSGQPEEAARRVFQAWLQESPVHMGAYLDVAGNWHRTGSADFARLGSVEELIAQALQDSAVVIPYPGAVKTSIAGLAGTSKETTPGGDASRHTSTPPMRRFALAACLAASVIVVACIGWLVHAPAYSTDIGEQRSIVLRDGSTVNLNSRSRIRIRYSGRERAVDLLEGQALFNVAKDATRPFIVIAGSTQVRAVGTEFDVYCKPTGTVVTVVEGRVAVFAQSTDTGGSAAGSSQGKAPAERLEEGAGVRVLSAGEQLMVTRQEAALPVPANIAAATAWTQRQLIFDSTPLDQVADEFNRYNERQFVIRDPDLNTFQIDGVFSSTDPTSLIRFLRARPDMQVIESGSEIVIARR